MAEAFLMHHIHTGGGGGGTDLVTWQNGSDDQLASMVEADRAGSIDLRDYWSVGDERTVVLSAITPTTTGIDETQPIQPITFVLLHKGGDNDDYRFIVGTKECLSEAGKLDTVNNKTCFLDLVRQTWLDNEFRAALPEAFRSIFKLWTCYCGTRIGAIQSSSVYFSLAAEKEITGTNSWGRGEGSLFQFDYYKTAANRIKINGVNGSACKHWTRSIRHSAYTIVYISESGTLASQAPSGANPGYLAPIGRI